MRNYEVKIYDLHVFQGTNWELWLQKGRGEYSGERHVKLRLRGRDYEAKNVVEEVYNGIMEEALSGKLDIHNVEALLKTLKSLT